MIADTNAPDAPGIRDLILTAEEARRVAAAAKLEVERAIEGALRNCLRVGVVVDCNRVRGLPQYLWDVRVLGGNDRGSRIYRIDSEPTVHMDTGNAGLAQWRCKATPISPKTGMPMSAKSHGADSVIAGGLLTLQGYVFGFHLLAPAESAAEAPATPAEHREAELRVIEQFIMHPTPPDPCDTAAAPARITRRP